MTITYRKVEISDMNAAYIERTNADATLSIIPIDDANADYQSYLESLEK